MERRNAISAFSQQHSFDATALQVEERDAIQCVVDCHSSINEGYVALPSAVLERDMTVGLIWQLYERCTDHIKGALVAMATACAAASEIVARSSIEAAVTIRYILRDRNLRLASFLRNHVEQAERQEKQWRKAADQLKGQEKLVYLDACDYRHQGIAIMKGFVDAISSILASSTPIPSWPSISSRFELIGEGILYRTVYARLCTETHFDAEETLRYFIGKSTSRDIFEKLAIETYMSSRLMLAEAVRSYAEAGKVFAICYNMPAAIETCTAAEHVMHYHCTILSSHIGGHPNET